MRLRDLSQCCDRSYPVLSAPRNTTRPRSSARSRLTALAICLGLILAILAIYAQVVHFDFINYDDPGYVVENAAVRNGLTFSGLRWAFTSVVLGCWTPVTLLSHMLVCELFGVSSGMHHVVNVLLHMLAALLLFASLHRATGALGRSGFVAFVFALHPLHVGSVVWIAERKDVLSACFFFLALYAYVWYKERPRIGRYFVVFALFGLGLMSKPMLVTFPFVLLLFDIWPLRRRPAMQLLLEKLPLAALSAVIAVVTYRIQVSLGAVASQPLNARIENSLISYITYIAEMFWPAHLAVFYPAHPIAVWQAFLALTFIVSVSALAFAAWRIRPYLAVGWFWYLGTLVPVIGLVQAGLQSHADRYSYIPMVGLSILVGWGAVDLARKLPRTQFAFAIAAIAACAVYPVLAWKEVAHWRDTETLFQHAIDVTENNWLAQGTLGSYLMNVPGRRGDAVEHLQTAVRLEPRYAEANNNLGICLLEAGLCTDAIRHFEASLRVKPRAFQPLDNIGACLSKMGHYSESVGYFETAARERPDAAAIQYNLAVALGNIPGRRAEAIAHFEKALRLQPDYPEAEDAFGVLLANLGRTKEALSYLQGAELLHPDPAIETILDRLRASAGVRRGN